MYLCPSLLMVLSSLLLSLTLIHVIPAQNPSLYTSQSLYTILLPLHNTLRRSYSAAPLVWSTALTTQATAYARRCLFTHPEGVGTNLAVGYASPADAFQAWTKPEEKAFKGNGGRVDEKTAHFTQVVWKGTEEIGCAGHFCEGEGNRVTGWFLVCVYSPGGNLVGEERKNIGAAGGPGSLPGGAQEDPDGVKIWPGGNPNEKVGGPTAGGGLLDPKGFFRGVMKSKGKGRERKLGWVVAVVSLVVALISLL